MRKLFQIFAVLLAIVCLTATGCNGTTEQEKDPPVTTVAGEPFLVPDTVEYDRSISPTDVTFTVDLNNGQFTKIQVGDEQGTSMTDLDAANYIFENPMLTIKGSYLSSLEIGTYSFRLVTTGGTMDFAIIVNEASNPSSVFDFEDGILPNNGSEMGITGMINWSQNPIDGDYSVEFQTNPTNGYGGGGAAFVFNFGGERFAYEFVAGQTYSFSFDFRLDTPWVESGNGDWGVLGGRKDVLMNFGSDGDWGDKLGFLKYTAASDPSEIGEVTFEEGSAFDSSLTKEGDVYTLTFYFVPTAEAYNANGDYQFTGTCWMNGTITLDNIEVTTSDKANPAKPFLDFENYGDVLPDNSWEAGLLGTTSWSDNPISGEKSLKCTFTDSGNVLMFNFLPTGNFIYQFKEGTRYDFSFDFRLDSAFTVSTSKDWGNFGGVSDAVLGFGLDNKYSTDRFGYVKYTPGTDGSEPTLEYVKSDGSQNGADGVLTKKENGVYNIKISFVAKNFEDSFNLIVGCYMAGEIVVDDVWIEEAGTEEPGEEVLTKTFDFENGILPDNGSEMGITGSLNWADTPISGQKSVTFNTKPDENSSDGGAAFVFHFGGTNFVYDFQLGKTYSFSMKFRLDSPWTETANGDWGVLGGKKDVLMCFGEDSSWADKFGYLKYTPAGDSSAIGTVEFVAMEGFASSLTKEGDVYTLTFCFVPTKYNANSQYQFSGACWMNGIITMDDLVVSESDEIKPET